MQSVLRIDGQAVRGAKMTSLLACAKFPRRHVRFHWISSTPTLKPLLDIEGHLHNLTCLADGGSSVSIRYHRLPHWRTPYNASRHPFHLLSDPSSSRWPTMERTPPNHCLNINSAFERREQLIDDGEHNGCLYCDGSKRRVCIEPK